MSEEAPSADAAKRDLLGAWDAALAAVDPGPALTRALAAAGAVEGRAPVEILAAGKGACAMAAAAVAVAGERLRGGAVTTKDDHARPVPGLEVREAAHPLPDERSVAAARDALERGRALGPECELQVLISGGASSLWCAPSAPLTLADLRVTADRLMRAGADIAALNCVRSALSDIKAGGLLRAASGAARVRTFALSDVRNDVPEQIGSGPTVPVRADRAAALAVLCEAGLESVLPPAVLRFLRADPHVAGARAAEPSARGGARIGERIATHDFRVVASLEAALAAVRAHWSVRPFVDLGASLYGPVEACARRLAAAAAAAPAGSRIVAGGEPTVVVTGSGRGGRAQELALRLALELEMRALSGWVLLCAGTDGSDGPTDAAGAIADCSSLERMRRAGVDPRAALADSASHAAWAACGDLFAPGPTGTNVNDLVLIAIGPGGPDAARRPPT